jgi:hypothetical protein
MLHAVNVDVCCVDLFPGLASRVPDGIPLVVTKNVQSALKDFKDGDDSGINAHWALLVAGSMGWGNYRHQADICHAYQVLKEGGLDDEHIVVMMYDDIADNAENIYPGEIYNKPGGCVLDPATPDTSVRRQSSGPDQAWTGMSRSAPHLILAAYASSPSPVVGW